MAIGRVVASLVLALVLWIGDSEPGVPRSLGGHGGGGFQMPGFVNTWTSKECESVCPDATVWMRDMMAAVLAGTVKLNMQADSAGALVSTMNGMMPISCGKKAAGISCALREEKCKAGGAQILAAIPCLCSCDMAMPLLGNLSAKFPKVGVGAGMFSNMTVAKWFLDNHCTEGEKMADCFLEKQLGICKGFLGMNLMSSKSAIRGMSELVRPMCNGRRTGCYVKTMECLEKPEGTAALQPCFDSLAKDTFATLASKQTCCDNIKKTMTCVGSGTDGKSCVPFLASIQSVLSTKRAVIDAQCGDVTMPSEASLKAYPGNILGTTPAPPAPPPGSPAPAPPGPSPPADTPANRAKMAARAPQAALGVAFASTLASVILA